jgi:hypothetical protein
MASATMQNNLMVIDQKHGFNVQQYTDCDLLTVSFLLLYHQRKINLYGYSYNVQQYTDCDLLTVSFLLVLSSKKNNSI